MWLGSSQQVAKLDITQVCNLSSCLKVQDTVRDLAPRHCHSSTASCQSAHIAAVYPSGYCQLQPVWSVCSRDINFREFYFSIREFQISRLVEYAKRNAAFREDPRRSPRSRWPPPLTHWELITVVSRLLQLLARSWLPVSRWQVHVPGQVSAVHRQAAATDSS